MNSGQNKLFLPALTFTLLSLFIFPYMKLFAATYYIAVNGSDKNIGTKYKPWATLNKAHRVISIGDTLYVRGGTYKKQSTVIWNKSGNQSQPIIIQAYQNEQPIFDGTDFSSHLFLIKEADWIIIDGLEAFGYRCCIWMGYSGSGSNFSENNIIRNNYFHDTKEHCIYLSWGIRNVKVYNNRLENPGDDLGTKGYCIHGWHYPGIKGTKIFNNVIIGGYGGIIFADGARDIEIYHNVFYDNYIGLRFDFYGEGEGDEGFVKNVTIKNNIIYSTNQNLWGAWVAKENMSEIKLDYNLWFRSDSSAYIKWADKWYTLKQFQNETPNGANSIEIDPQFVNISRRNFHLQSTSLAIDNGSPILIVNKDKDNVLRPQGSGYDIGVYEFVKQSSTFPDLNPPNPPTGVKVLGRYINIGF